MTLAIADAHRTETGAHPLPLPLQQPLSGTILKDKKSRQDKAKKVNFGIFNTETRIYFRKSFNFLSLKCF